MSRVKVWAQVAFIIACVLSTPLICFDISNFGDYLLKLVVSYCWVPLILLRW